MDDTESAALTARIRAANPLTSRRDAPLSLRAQDDLRRLLEGADAAPAAAPARKGFRGLLGRLRTRRLAIGGGISGLTVGAAIAVIAVAISVSTPSASWAVTPPPLEVTPVSGTVASVAADLGAKAAAQRVPATTGTITITTQSWSIATSDEGFDTSPSSWVEPQEQTVVRRADGSGSITFHAGNWDYGTPPGAQHRTPGSFIESTEKSAGQLTTILPTAPATAGDLQKAIAAQGKPSASTLFDVIESTARDWPTTGSAYLAAVAATPGVSLVGEVTDRLGRDGIAFSATGAYGNQQVTRTLIFDHSTGALLSSEVALRSGAKSLAAGDVLQYTCWE